MRPQTSVDAPGAVDGQGPADADGLARALAELERTAGDDPRACLALAPRVERAALRLGDDSAVMQVAYHASRAHEVLAEDTAALTSMERALRLARSLGDRAWEARVLTGLAGTHHSFGDRETAIDLLEDSLAIRQEMGDVLGVAQALADLGRLFEEMGLFPDRTRELLHEARTHFASLGHATGQATCLLHLAKLELTDAEATAADDPELARIVVTPTCAMAADAVAHARAAGDQRLLASCLVREGRALLLAGDLDAAHERLDEASRIYARSGTSHLATELTVVRSRLHRATGRTQDAVDALEGALRATAEYLRSGDRLQVLAELVDVHEERGDLAAALALHRELLTVTLAHREESAERRARALNEKRDLERARLEAEMERLRSAQLELANKVLAHHAMHDGLTGVANRRAIDEELAARIEQSERGIRSLACVVADLDHFKRVNDEHSHMVGDEALRRVAQVLQASVRDSDLVGRLGGEEFVLLLAVDPGPDGDAALARVCERVRSAVADHPWDGVAPGLRVTTSVGGTRHRPGESADDLLERADALMYRAKRAGRDRVVLDGDVD